jgi:hypothetical protein
MAANRGIQQTYGTMLRELDDRVTATREEYFAATRDRYRVMRQAADEGMSQRATGDLMDISKQRVQQILAAGEPSWALRLRLPVFVSHLARCMKHA